MTVQHCRVLSIATSLLALAGVMAVTSTPLHAQGYPRVPADEQRLANERMVAADRRSDDVFAKALPTIREWEKKGKPYIPSASEPGHLPQAPIPAFPGAEGGGMYSFGGRGGRVLVVTNLNDDGPGSFREACETPGPVFSTCWAARFAPG